MKLNVQLTKAQAVRIMRLIEEDQAKQKRSSGQWKQNCALARAFDKACDKLGGMPPDSELNVLSYTIGL